MAAAREINLDKARAARAEQRAKAGEPATKLVLEGERYELPPELPMSVIDAYNELNQVAAGPMSQQQEDDAVRITIDVVQSVMGPALYDKLKGKLFFEDVRYMLTEVAAVYGVSLGESPASLDSAPTTSTP